MISDKPADKKTETGPDAKADNKTDGKTDHKTDSKTDLLLQENLQKLEKAFFSIKFYPVAVKEKDMKDAISEIHKLYSAGDEPTKQMVIYFIHDFLSASVQLKFMQNQEFFQMKNRNSDLGQVRMDVYRAMFNYNTSLEGLIAMIGLLASLDSGNSDNVKLLTYHYSHLSTIENEASRTLRNAILDALGECDSEYALNALLNYAKYTDDERILNRLAASLSVWMKKIEELKISEKDRRRISSKLQQVLSKELGSSHYG